MKGSSSLSKREFVVTAEQRPWSFYIVYLLNDFFYLYIYFLYYIILKNGGFLGGTGQCPGKNSNHRQVVYTSARRRSQYKLDLSSQQPQFRFTSQSTQVAICYLRTKPYLTKSLGFRQSLVG